MKSVPLRIQFETADKENPQYVDDCRRKTDSESCKQSGLAA